MHGRKVGSIWSRLLAIPVVAVVTLAGFAVAPAGASPVGGSLSGTGICLGYPDAGGCALGFGGTTTGTAGSTVLLGAAFTATSGASLDIILEGSGTGIAFPSDAGDYQVNNSATLVGCGVTDVSVYNSGATAFVSVPEGCAASPGQQLVVLVRNTTLPAATGPFSITLQTTEDFGPVGTNTLDVVSVPSAPSVPKNASESRGDRSVTVSWSAPDDIGSSAITGYRVYCSSGTPSTADAPSATTDASTASTTVSGLSTHTTYSCVVTAVNATGQSAASDLVSAIPYGPPTAPQNFSSIRGNGSVTVFWDKPTDVGGTPLTGYSAYCSTSFPPSVSPADACGHFGAAARSGVVRGLTNGVTYYIGVVASNVAGASPLSGIGGPTPAGPPSRPWALRAKPYAGSLMLRWKVPTSDGSQPITQYAIFCSTDDPPSVSGPASAFSALNHVRVSGLTSGTPYYCVVFADNSIGRSVSSFVVTGTPR